MLIPTVIFIAACKKTGRSTSGGIVTVGSHVLKTYSRQLKTVALSSTEGELHAMVAASAEALGIVSLLRDREAEAVGEVYADSSEANENRPAAGHGLSYKKVLGSRKPSDILTKHVASTLLDQHLMMIGNEF